MKLTQQQQEKITMGIQAVLGLLIIGLSVRNSTKIQTAQMKKLSEKDARHQSRLQKSQYRLDKKLMKQTYKAKLKKVKK